MRVASRLISSLIFLCLFIFLFTSKASATTKLYPVTDGFQVDGGKGIYGTVLFFTSFSIEYQSGNIILSKDADGTGIPDVGDTVQVIVQHADSSQNVFNYGMIEYCGSPHVGPSSLPTDITSFFQPGHNNVTVRFSNWCTTAKTISSVNLVNTNIVDSTPTPTLSPTPTPSSTPTPPAPFLDLPWDYESKGITFNEAALNITSFFDHEYPLLSSGLIEQAETPKSILTFRGFPRTDESYSSHDGYDYALKANVHYSDNILAAAAGWATYIDSCGACGNMVIIDHGNGYQTRYMHMQKDGLVTNTPGQKVWVNDRQIIGKVGATGNCRPKEFPEDIECAHIHFGVFQDKNHDGNFDDNIPDGVTDPFGWQSKDPDPWVTYSFFYNGQQRTGNKSYYLWKNKLDGLDDTLTANGGNFSAGRYSITFPQDTVTNDATLSMQAAPATKVSNSLTSVGSTMKISVTDALGGLITLFSKPLLITIDFSKIDLSSFKLGTFAVYSSSDGTHWNKEEQNAFIDYLNKKATVEVNHLTYFALMAEPADTVAPTTIATINGRQGQANLYHSDVQVNLVATDNAGGLGVDYTLYKVNDSDWSDYKGSLTFTQEGSYTIQFYSGDNAGNIEEIKSQTFSIDKTPPEATIQYNLQNFDIQITGLDSSGSAAISVDNTKKLQPKFTITDLAGNSLVINANELKINKDIVFGINTLQYNTNTPISINKNIFSTVVMTNKQNIIQSLDQYYAVKDDKQIFTSYLQKTNITKIFTKSVGAKFIELDKNGLILLQLTTDNGTIKYSY